MSVGFDEVANERVELDDVWAYVKEVAAVDAAGMLLDGVWVYRRRSVGETAKCFPCSMWARGWTCAEMKVMYMSAMSSVAVVRRDSRASPKRWLGGVRPGEVGPVKVFHR